MENGLIAIKAHPLREHGLGNYRQVDDAPYGGGSRMVMRPEPIAAAIDAVKQQSPGLWRILMTPQGEVFDNSMARDLAKRMPGLMIVAGRYEGIDERVRSLVNDRSVDRQLRAQRRRNPRDGGNRGGGPHAFPA